MAAGRHPAVVVDGEELSYAWLLRAMDELRARMSTGGAEALVTIVGDRSLPELLTYLAALDNGIAVAWLKPDLSPVALAEHMAAFRPDYVVARTHILAAVDSAIESPAGVYRREHWSAAGGRIETDVLVRTADRHQGTVAPTALLLSTSGSTGGPRYVRLSRNAVEANAAAIAQALRLNNDARAATSLPLHYTYGLSVVNSTLTAGGSLVLTPQPPTGLAFWQQVALRAITHVACVPFHVEMIMARRPTLLNTTPVRLVTVAGGALAPPLAVGAATILARTTAGLSLMYGMTEATARISVLPPEDVLTRSGSAGLPVQGTRVYVEDEQGAVLPEGQEGRIVVHGPGVMLGYATDRADLAALDVCRGVLRTGDRGCLRDGYVYVRGRSNRVVKVAGQRVELDQLERLYVDLGPAAAVAVPSGRAAVFVEGVAPDRLRARHAEVCRALHVTTGTVTARTSAQLPRLTSGKIDYEALAASCGPGGVGTGRQHEHRNRGRFA